jgi:hypothetical protein
MKEEKLIKVLQHLTDLANLQAKKNKNVAKQLKLLDQQIEMIFFDVSNLSQRIRNLER